MLTSAALTQILSTTSLILVRDSFIFCISLENCFNSFGFCRFIWIYLKLPCITINCRVADSRLLATFKVLGETDRVTLNNKMR